MFEGVTFEGFELGWNLADRNYRWENCVFLNGLLLSSSEGPITFECEAHDLREEE